MRIRLFIALLGFLTTTTSCQKPVQPGINTVAIIGAIHSGHRISERYSLDILRDAVIDFRPDVILIELPRDRFQQASDNYKQYGEVRESRADDFPELTEVIFPLRAKLGFTMVPVAAWTEEIASNRRTTMQRLENDPSRAKDWTEYQKALKRYNRIVAGKSDDPLFIHSDEYDDAVKARQETLERLFGDDLGTGGWANINKAHLALMKTALDEYGGQEKRILILYGAWHKYKIQEGLEGLKGYDIIDVNQYFIP